MKKVSFIILLVVLTVSLFATNGMNMIGYGPRSSAMGGFSLGLTDDVNSTNTNPAAISFINHKQLDASIGLLIPKVNFKNSLNDVEGESEIFPLPNFSYVNGNDCKFTWGLAFYSQGGMGATYKNVNHQIFMNQDGSYQDLEYHSMIGYMKLTPSLSYQVNERFALGISPNVGYAMMEMKMPYSLNPSAMKGVIPDAITTQMGFPSGSTFGNLFASPGFDYTEVTAYADMGDAATAYGFGARIGASYKANEKLSMGFAYGSKSTLTFEGEAKMDMTAQFGDAYMKMLAMMSAQPNPEEAVNYMLSGMGIDMSLGMISDYDVEIEMAWPQEFGFGMAFSPNEKLLVGADVKWINWKDSMKEFKMKFTDGTNQNINTMMGSEDMELTMPLEWDDQVVIALGAEFKVNPKFALRCGYNFANNPVPEETIIPIFPAVVENHITLGFGYNLTDKLGFDAAYELNLEKEVEVEESIIANEYSGSTDSLSENVLHFGINYKF